MSKKHSMTIKERLENRKESLYERVFDWIWDHTTALFKFLWGIIKELFIGTSMAIDKHDAKVASGQIKPHNYLRSFLRFGRRITHEDDYYYDRHHHWY